jgi:methyl halide transferase
MKSSLDTSEYWDKRYISGNSGWDLNTPTPAFSDILKENKIIQPGKLIILGAGKCFDAVEAARSGYDVTAVEFSQSAAEFGMKLAEREKAKVQFVIEDFFNLPDQYINVYDVVYDYVTYCAINPGRREEYAKLVKSFLKQGGKFVIILFPVEDRQGGPPFGLNQNETESVFSKYLKLILSTDKIDSIKPRKGREILQVYQKQK